ncbi:hypothetical protein C8Q79DRAFT_727641 [Trametes meyenii]|nr:hypothetical protein C8Q79DRAFT_727641 [Trametes meyenii]
MRCALPSTDSLVLTHQKRRAILTFCFWVPCGCGWANPREDELADSGGRAWTSPRHQRSYTIGRERCRATTPNA